MVSRFILLSSLCIGAVFSTIAPTPAPTPASTPASTPAPTPSRPRATRPAVCIKIDVVSTLYLPVTVDSNGDIATLSDSYWVQAGCEGQDWSDVPIAYSCGCDYRRKFNTNSTGYDLDATFWCNVGIVTFNIIPPNPYCTAAPTPAPTQAPTPQPTPAACITKPE
ncbi:hypothetical protein LEN26_010872 [Aphanomyces euteiches]|nr:hypothetical protein LEN26_010872 [Aphanomyces euteiches]KAH9127997.1 hypothetical protein AeMF1_001774 [Aphanomyces euteiches]KAH9184908.1 hypothetical protein AeNC1_013115 [Aphanomyces euteiches]